jgi:hypothetical protein
LPYTRIYIKEIGRNWSSEVNIKLTIWNGAGSVLSVETFKICAAADDCRQISSFLAEPEERRSIGTVKALKLVQGIILLLRPMWPSSSHRCSSMIQWPSQRKKMLRIDIFTSFQCELLGFWKAFDNVSYISLPNSLLLN